MHLNFLVFLFLPAMLWAQDHTIKGQVTDYTLKTPIEGGKVRLWAEDYAAGDTQWTKTYTDFMSNEWKDTMIINPKRKLLDSTSCDKNGQYSFSNLSKGYYSVSFIITVDTVPGFKSYGRYIPQNFRFHKEEGILVNKEVVNVDMSLPVYCEYAQYFKQDSCPICKKRDNLGKVVYGLPEYNPDDINVIKSKDREYMIGYCSIEPQCYARWYCWKCKKLF